MKHMPLKELMPVLHDAAYVTGESSPPRAIVGTYRQLVTIQKLKAAEKRLLFECCLLLEAYNFSRLQSEAQATREALEAANPKFNFRPDPKPKKGET